MTESTNHDLSTPSRKLLIVEDDQIMALNLAHQLLPFGFELCGHCTSESQALKLIEDNSPDIILLDINLGSGGSGISIAEKIRRRHCIPFVYLTAHSENDIMSSALATAPYGYVIKPAKPTVLKAALETALIRHQMETKERSLSKRYSDLFNRGKIVACCSKEESELTELIDHTSLVNNIGSPGFISKDKLLQVLPLNERDNFLARLSRQGTFCHQICISPESDAHQGKARWLDLFIVEYNKTTETVFIGLIIDSTESTNLINTFVNADPLTDTIDTGFVFLNESFQITNASGHILDLLGYSLAELSMRDFDQITLQDRREEKNLGTLKLNKHFHGEINLRAKNGKIIPTLATVDRMTFEGTPDQYVLSITNLSQVRSRHQLLTRLAFTDPLTGLGNRAFFYRLFDLIDQQIIKPSGRICCIFIDLDSFKLINDNFGHSLGDDFLRVVSERLKVTLRESDYLTRLGGDEFAIVIIDGPKRNVLEELARKIIHAIKEPIYIDGDSYSLTCSIGISVQSDQQTDPDKLLREADMAMYQCKSLGKDQYGFYEPVFGRTPLSPLILEQGLRNLLKENSLIAHYQPIIDGRQNIIAFEVLARWFHEKHRWISPQNFIQVAEQSGLIHVLGAKMLQQACIAIKLLENTHLSGLLAYVNVSPYQLKRKRFAEHAVDIASEFEVTPSRIVFEITESSMTQADEMKTIRSLQEQGFQLAVDDFGTGYSALASLKDCFADTIKLDKRFLQLADTDRRDRLILERITDLCLALGYNVLAEGIETRSQLERARKCGCQLFQGFYFQKPVDLQQFLKLHSHYPLMSNGTH